MWRLTWQLLGFGIPLEFTTPQSIEAIDNEVQNYNRNKRRKAWRNRSRIKVMLKENQIKAFNAEFRVFPQPKAILNADLEAAGESTRVKGRFQFQVLTRSIFWLAFIGLLVYESLWINRLVQRLLSDWNVEFVVGTSILLLPAPLIGIVLFSILNQFTRRAGQDISRMSDVLKELVT